MPMATRARIAIDFVSKNRQDYGVVLSNFRACNRRYVVESMT